MLVCDSYSTGVAQYTSFFIGKMAKLWGKRYQKIKNVFIEKSIFFWT